METILEILRKTTDFFTRKGLSQPRLDAEWLLAHGLGLKRMDLYLQFERPLALAEIEKLRPLVQARGRRVPLQHLLGEMEFLGCRIHTDSRALIPRPETEEGVALLVENVSTAPKRILDLGTGSGCIALALARHFPEAEVVAVDTSAEALDLARENASRNRIDTVSWLPGHWFEPVSGRFDWIVSNPPYLSKGEWENAQPEVRDHDPATALVADADGLADLRHILREAPAFLHPRGLLFLETGADQHPLLVAEARTLPYATVESKPDLSGRDRFLLLRAPSG